MNLIVDAGNTFVKWAIFKEDNIVKKDIAQYEELENTLMSINKRYPKVKSCMISSVGNFPLSLIPELKKSYEVYTLDYKTNLPFKNLYETPKTLGVDRIALISACVEKFPEKPCLVIDAGTCITYDFVDANKLYYGGSISPGIRLRYQALHNFTAKLPLLETKQPKGFIGSNTQEAIHSGVIHGVSNEIDGIIDNYKLNYPDLTVILTGGDANFLSKNLKSTIFANSNFLLEGLNFILKHNLD